MPSFERSRRSSPADSGRSARLGSSRQRQQRHPVARPQPPPPPGPGIAPLLLGILLIAGTITVLARSGVFSSGGTRLPVDDVPACPGALNRWADQQLQMMRAQLEQDHGLYRSQGQSPNAIGAAMTWIDDRIIDQRLGEERQRLRSTLLQSSRCLVRLQS